MRLHVHRLVLLLLLFALPAYAQGPQSIYFPGGQVSGGTGTTGSFQNLHIGPGQVSISGSTANGTDQISDVNFNGVINVKTGGAVGDDVHGETAAINSAEQTADSAKARLYFPKGTYRVNHDLNVTHNQPGKGFCIYGDGPAQASIDCHDTGGNCIDASGSDGYDIRDINLNGDRTDKPNTILLQARVANDATGFSIRLSNVWMNNYGPYIMYNYGGEIANCYNCKIGNDGLSNPGPISVVISTSNQQNITSAFHP